MTRSEAIEAAARLKRNVIISPGIRQEFVGEWIAVPRTDFEALRAALALPPDPPPTCVTCEREAAPDPPAPGERCPCCGKETDARAIVFVERGIVAHVTTPPGFAVEVRDFDCEGCDDCGEAATSYGVVEPCHVSEYRQGAAPDECRP